MVITTTSSATSATRATVCWIMVASPTILVSCLGRASVLAGQNRVPAPPAMTTAHTRRCTPTGSELIWDSSVDEAGSVETPGVEA